MKTKPYSYHEIADLDSLIGFKGNYLIFQMKRCNPLTCYLAQPYVDEMIPPDELNAWLADEGLLSEVAEQFVADAVEEETQSQAKDSNDPIFGLDPEWQVVTASLGLEYIEALPDHVSKEALYRSGELAG